MSEKGDNSSQPQSEREGLTEDEVNVREHRRVTAEKQKIQRDKEALEQEIARLRQAVDSGEGGLQEFTLTNQTGEEANRETWKRIESEARRLKPPLRNSLQQTQKTNEQRGTRVGRFDSKLGYRLATNNLNINKRVSRGELKQYTVVIVLDRSGSMQGQITDAEAAAGGFAKALEEIGVSVAVIDLYRDTARMVKPFGSSTEQAKGGLASGDVGGTTPLTDALVLSRERVRQGEHYPFMIVISDGLPNEKQTYLNELSKTSFPVVGVNITRSTTVDEGFRDCYDVCEKTRPENLTQTLSTVAQRVIF
jgi:Mg-chelatase subunit ChlD